MPSTELNNTLNWSAFSRTKSVQCQTEECCQYKPTFETLHGIDSFCQTDFVQKLNDVECQTDIESVIYYNEIQNDIYEDVRTENKGNICDCCNLSDVTKQLKIAINIDHTHIDLNQFSSNSNISTLSLSLHNDAQDLNDDQHFEENHLKVILYWLANHC